VHFSSNTKLQDTIVSVLEVSATKREAKGYLQTYTSRPRALTETPRFEQGSKLPQAEQEAAAADQDAPHVAIVKLRRPQDLESGILHGVARTLYQLRALGLLSIVVLDCGVGASRELVESQALSVCEALDSFSKPGAKFLESVAVASIRGGDAHSSSHFASRGYRIDDIGQLRKAISHGLIPVLPALARKDETAVAEAVDANQLVLALTKYVSGMQFEDTSMDWDHGAHSHAKRPLKMATVERIIILDPVGGTPIPGGNGTPLRFVNLEQEYEGLVNHFTDSIGLPPAGEHTESQALTHALNLSLARDALSLLPPSSSTLITSPSAAANTAKTTTSALAGSFNKNADIKFNGMVTTRRMRNPLLHNLITDKPVHSSSLPAQRVVDEGHDGRGSRSTAAPATLVTRGMP
jgi:amino-acid N-acetyltransferase